MRRKPYQFPKDMNQFGNYYYDEGIVSGELNFISPEYDGVISKIDPVIGEKLIDIRWNANRYGERLILEFVNGKQTGKASKATKKEIVFS